MERAIERLPKCLVRCLTCCLSFKFSLQLGRLLLSPMPMPAPTAVESIESDAQTLEPDNNPSNNSDSGEGYGPFVAITALCIALAAFCFVCVMLRDQLRSLLQVSAIWHLILNHRRCSIWGRSISHFAIYPLSISLLMVSPMPMQMSNAQIEDSKLNSENGYQRRMPTLHVFCVYFICCSRLFVWLSSAFCLSSSEPFPKLRQFFARPHETGHAAVP